MSDIWFMPSPCKHCPFLRSVRPFLHPDRAAELAYATSNRFSDFTCHKTLDHDDEEGETCVGPKSLKCAGFLSMQVNEAGRRTPEGFEPSDQVYNDAWDMIDAYEEAWTERMRA